jgi:hypothetical protein
VRDRFGDRHPLTMRPLLLRIVPLALVAACVSKKLQTPSPQDSAAREAALLTPLNLTFPRHCRIIDPDLPLPDVATVIDTAGMPELLRQAAVPVTSGYALFSIRFDSAGHPSRARLIAATFADSLRDGVQQSVASALLDRSPGAQHPMRLRVDLSAHPTFRLGKSEYCKAEARTARGPIGPVMLDAPGERTISRGTTMLSYEVEVASSGEVLAVRFLYPLDAQAEQAMRQSLMKVHWQPALDDGLPVDSRVSVSVPIKTRTVVRAVGP